MFIFIYKINILFIKIKNVKLLQKDSHNWYKCLKSIIEITEINHLAVLMKSKIKLAIIENQTLYRQGLKRILHEYERVQIVGEFSHGMDFIEWIKSNDVNIVLMDLKISDINAKYLMDYISTNYPLCKIIGLADSEDEDFTDQFIAKGGRALLLKNKEFLQINDVIDSVVEIGYFFNNRFSIHKIKRLLDKKVIKPVFKTTHLTDREIQIVQLICLEKTTQEIADELFITSKTVEGHRERIMLKTKSKNVVGIALYAVKHNLIRIE